MKFASTGYTVHGRRGEVVGEAQTLDTAKRLARDDAGLLLRWKWEEVNGVKVYYSDGDYTITPKVP